MLESLSSHVGIHISGTGTTRPQNWAKLLEKNFLCKMQGSIDSRNMSQDFYNVMFTIQASRDMFIKIKERNKDIIIDTVLSSI